MRYPVLTAIVALYYVGAALTAAVTIGIALKRDAPLWTIAAGFAAAVATVAIAEVIRLLMNIEENTRASNAPASQQRAVAPSSAEPIPPVPTAKVG